MKFLLVVACFSMLILGSGFTSSVIGRDLSDFEFDGVTSWILLDSLNKVLKSHALKIRSINDFELLKSGEKVNGRNRVNVYLIGAEVTLDNGNEMESLTRVIISRQRNSRNTGINWNHNSMLVSSKNNASYKKRLAEDIKWVRNNSD